MERLTQNTSLFDCNVELRDNGVLSIGTIFLTLIPRPIESPMAGDITLLNTNFLVVVMKFPIY